MTRLRIVGMAGARDQHDLLLDRAARAWTPGPFSPAPMATSISVPARPPDANSVSMLSTRRRARGIFAARAATIARQLHDLSDVRDRERKLAIRRRRIEAVAVNRLVEIAERARQRRRRGPPRAAWARRRGRCE